MVKVTIDGRNIEVRDGATILEAARAGGIHTIPTLCYDKRLSPYGSCRICLVEVAGSPKMAAACSMPVWEGMEVTTRSPAIEKARREILELLLIHHPLDCPECDSAGECALQDYTFDYGQFETRFEAKKHSREKDSSVPLVVRDPNRCIYCGRCVRVCGELQGVHAIDYINRGFASHIAPPFDESLDCEFCGQCIEVCPVGALTSKPFRHKARPWELESVTSTCGFCATGCTVEIDIKKSKSEIVRVRASEEKGINDYSLCGKGRFGFEFVNHPERLELPLRRSEGQLKETSWSEAIRSAAFSLKSVVEKSGAGAVGGIGSGRSTNEANYLFQKLFRLGLGSDNLDTTGGVTYMPGREVINGMLGLGNAYGSLDDLAEADMILVVDSDITDTHPVFSLPILKAARYRGVPVVTANSRASKLTRHSSRWIRIRPGEGASFLAAVIKSMTDRGLEKPAEGAEDLKRLESSMEKRSVESLATRVGAETKAIDEAAGMFAAAKKAVIVLSTSSADLSKGEEIAKAAANLVLLSGGGSGRIFFLPETNNLQGACDFGVRAGLLPGWKYLSDEKAKEQLDAAWGGPFLIKEGQNLEGMLTAAEKGDLKALVIMGANPLVSLPDHNRVKNALAGLDLLIVIDQFLTETAQEAAFVLPALGWAEVDGSYTNAEGRVQRVVSAPVRDRKALPDVEILEKLADALGKGFSHNGPEELRAEMAAAVPVYANAFSAFSDGAVPGHRWPLDAPAEPSGRFRFLYLDQDSFEEKTDSSFLLVTGSLRTHSGSMTRRCPALVEVAGETRVYLNPVDAEKIGVKNGDMVAIQKPGKSSMELPAELDENLYEGTVFVPVHFGDQAIHRLTDWPAAGRSLLSWVQISVAQKG